jgi:HK97 family phage major capsid protein
MTIKNTLKALRKTDDEIRVGNYIILFGGRDLEFVNSGRNPDGSLGTFFSKNVDVDSVYTKAGVLPVSFEHGMDPDETGTQSALLGIVDWKTMKKDEYGIFVERVLKRREKYVQFVEELVDAGLIGTSSEAVPGQVKCLDTGEIVRFPLRGDTLTVQPCEPRMLSGNQLSALRGLSKEFPAVQALLDKFSASVDSGSIGGAPICTLGGTGLHAGRKTDKQTYQPKKGVKSMNILEAIKKLLPGLKPEQYDALAAILGLAGVEAPAAAAADAAGSMDPGTEPMKSIDINKLSTQLKAMGFVSQTPEEELKKMAKSLQSAGFVIEAPKAVNGRPAYNWDDPKNQTEPEPETGAQKSINAAHMLKYKDESAAQKAVLEDVIGKDYRSVLYEQNVAYHKYLRGGDKALNSGEVKALQRQIFPLEGIFKMAGEMDMSSIKATQVEAQGELGGFAVPPNQQAEISTRLPGLTAVRGAGARVVTLTVNNSIQIPQYKGNSNNYRGIMRGSWGTEAQTPGEENFEVEMVDVIANLYTYKISYSQSLVEDAANLVSLVTTDIADTEAMDEDEGFIIGNGVGKPRGILPGGANADSLTAVHSGHDDALTAAGVKRLKRGIATQYRKNGVWIGNSDTFGAIEEMVATDGKFIFEDLSETDKLLNRKIFESEAMADVAANSIPLIFCDASGYTIVERLGMTIVRFQDSGTGINKVEYHVRKRVGGRLEQPWKFAIQEVAA